MLSAFIIIVRSCPAMPYQTTGRPETPTARSSRTGTTFRSSNKTLLLDSNQPVSRRSKPSSRSPLMGEQPHPWVLLHTHRVDMGSCLRPPSYPRGSFSVISSPHRRGHWGSLGPAFASEFLTIRNTVRLAYALTLYSGSLSHLNQPLGAFDIFSSAYRPSRTAHLPMSTTQNSCVRDTVTRK